MVVGPCSIDEGDYGLKVAVFGNLTLDEILNKSEARVVPGGSALYVSAASAFLTAQVSLFSNIGQDYPVETLKWLRDQGVDVSAVQRVSGPSTRLKLTYRNASRELRILQPGTKIGYSLLTGHWKGAHFGPVCGEVGHRLIRGIRPHSDFVSLDIQGLIRMSTRSGAVRLVPRRLDVLRICDLVKASEEEARAQTSANDPLKAAEALISQGAKNAIVTLGHKGAILALGNGRRFRVPAYPENEVDDPTGAGDSFVGSWLPVFLSTRDSVWAASVGSAFASMVLRRHGLSKFRLSREELFRRSAWVYGRVRTLGG